MNLTVLRENIKIVSIGLGLMIILILLIIPVINIAGEVGVDIKFGKVPAISIPAVVDQSRITNYTLNIQDRKSFGRLERVALIGRGKSGLSQGNKIAEMLGVKGGPKKVKNLGGVGSRYVWQFGGKVLTLSPEVGEISYFNSEAILDEGVKYTNNVKGVAEEFLKKSGLLGELKVSKEIPVEVRGALSLKNTEFSNGVELIFTKKFNNHEIVSRGIEGYVLVTVGYDQIIRKISYHTPGKILEEGIYPVINAKDAINTLKNNEATLYNVDVDGISSLVSNITLVSVDISEMRTVYVDSPTSKYLEPFYIFRGRAKTTEDKNVEVALLINAIKTKYLETE